MDLLDGPWWDNWMLFYPAYTFCIRQHSTWREPLVTLEQEWTSACSSFGAQESRGAWHKIHRNTMCSVVSDSVVTPWTVACQIPFVYGISRQENWNELPFPSPGGLPDPRIKPKSPALQADTLPSEPPGKPFLGEIIKIQHFNYSWFIFLCLDNCKESHRRPCLTYLLSNCLTCSPDENLTRSKLEGV